MRRYFIWAMWTLILTLLVACGGETKDEVYIREMNVLWDQHFEIHTNNSNEADQFYQRLLGSSDVGDIRLLAVEARDKFRETEDQFENVMNQWATLEPPEEARLFHTRAFEMMQLRLNGVRLGRIMLDTFLATGEFNPRTANEVQALFDESDRVYLEVVIEAQKVEAALAK